MKLKHGIKQMVADANAEITTLSIEEAKARSAKTMSSSSICAIPANWTARARSPAPSIVRAACSNSGSIPKAPITSPFSRGKQFVFYCMSGWRSALSTKTVQDMGLANVSHIAGGFNAWRKGGGEVEGGQRRGKRPRPGVLPQCT